MIVYLNGEYLSHEQAKVSVDDRGFLFADGVYEVARVYDGRIFAMPEHLERMAGGLRALRIHCDRVASLAEISERLLDENGLRTGAALVYSQVTRGAAPRKHSFPPDDVTPTVYVQTKPFEPHPDSSYRDGVPAITVPDTRWSRCDIKAVLLLANVLANQLAKTLAGSSYVR